MADFKQNGDTIKHTPGSAVTAGDVIVIEDKVCVAKHDIEANVSGDLDTNGVFAFDKAGVAFTQGKPVFIDGGLLATETVGTNKKIGYVHKSALSGDATVDCYLSNQVKG